MKDVMTVHQAHDRVHFVVAVRATGQVLRTGSCSYRTFVLQRESEDQIVIETEVCHDPNGVEVIDGCVVEKQP